MQVLQGEVVVQSIADAVHDADDDEDADADDADPGILEKRGGGRERGILVSSSVASKEIFCLLGGYVQSSVAPSDPSIPPPLMDAVTYTNTETASLSLRPSLRRFNTVFPPPLPIGSTSSNPMPDTQKV